MQGQKDSLSRTDGESACSEGANSISDQQTQAGQRERCWAKLAPAGLDPSGRGLAEAAPDAAGNAGAPAGLGPRASLRWVGAPVVVPVAGLEELGLAAWPLASA